MCAFDYYNDLYNTGPAIDVLLPYIVGLHRMVLQAYSEIVRRAESVTAIIPEPISLQNRCYPEFVGPGDFQIRLVIATIAIPAGVSVVASVMYGNEM